ncbi:hypothetical protein FB565_000395 [Actinoplanes lutulentus]|uniref:Uncharacterized protein n=1 Tax=Actinoplanes lutulentus TaxID=1287878 RepID=A0A327ZJJ2_9ACTN|nr:hypothetical protein [Actinoplanes lutulentus]MBB2940691.1 hypothetical protein [Actinoplanes lutulentus]RAK43002.1 hypothetical protein B0I29_101132 [Actinoplanes lutulentus]
MSSGRHEHAIAPPELPRREPYRTWPGALAVLAVILVYLGIVIVIDDHTPTDLEPVAAGKPLAVGAVLTVVPEDGYALDVSDSSPDPDKPSTQLVGPTGNFLISVNSWNGTLAQLVEREKDEFTAYADARPLGDDATFTAPGLSGTSFSLLLDNGKQARAWISVDETAKRSIVISAASPSEVFRQALPHAQAMVDSVRVEAQR